MDHNPDGMRKVMGEECHLVNEMKHCHPGKQLPNMYVQGHQSFDYALATEPVTMAVQHTGYEPVDSHFPTDHRPYYIDLSAPISFGLHLQLWAKYKPSFLVATNIHQVTAYTEKKYEYIPLQTHNAFKGVQRLTLPRNNCHQFEKRLRHRRSGSKFGSRTKW